MRRMWMLLLVTVLMVVALAVPAMAAEHTDHPEGTWVALTTETTEITAGGSYYLTGELTHSLTVSGGTVTICLNGQTWNGNGARPLTITGGSVTVCDCCYVAPSVDLNTGAVGDATGGKIQGHDYTGASGKGDGGAVNVSKGATFTLESGTITGGRASSGGNITSAGTVYLSGGVVRDGECGAYDASTNVYSNKGWGGNVNTSSNLTISGNAIITGGVSGGNGANVRVTSGTFTMTGGYITLGNSRDQGGNAFIQANASITGGYFIGGIACHGGNLGFNANKCTITLQNVTLKNGICAGSANANSTYDGEGNLVLKSDGRGGNLQFNTNAPTKVTIGTGTLLTGGQSGRTYGNELYINVSQQKNSSGTVTNDGIIDEFIIDGATIEGSVYFNNKGHVISFKNNVIIGKQGSDGLRFAGTKDTVDISAMTGGSVGAYYTTVFSFTSNASVDNEAKAAWFYSTNPNMATFYNTYNKKLAFGILDCACRTPDGENHVQFTDLNGNTVGCDGTLVPWFSWSEAGKVPVTEGNWYLTKAVTLTSQFRPEKDAVVRIDLAGFTIQSKDGSTLRLFTLSNAGATLEITDSVGTGMIKNTAAYDQGCVFWITAANTTVTLYAGTVDGRECSSRGYNGSGGNLISLAGENSRLYILGGTIYGSREDDPNTEADEGYEWTEAATNKIGEKTVAARIPARGGAIVIDKATAEANIYAGVIHGSDLVAERYISYNSSTSTVTGFGTATKVAGGAVNVSKGTLNMFGGTIYGGNLKNNNFDHDCDPSTPELQGKGYGGAINLESATTMNFYGGTVDGGHSDQNGGNIYVGAGATFNMLKHPTTNTVGTVQNGSTNDQGGNVFTSGKTTLSAGMITNGTAKNGGNVAVNANDDAGMFTTINGVSLTNGSATGNGGNLMINPLNKCTVNISGTSTITGGTANYGGNIYINTNNVNETKPSVTVNLTAGTITGGTGRYASPNVHINCSKDCSVTVNHDAAVNLDPYVALSGNLDGITFTTEMDTADFTVGGYTVYYNDFNTAWAAAALGSSYVALQKDFTESLNVASDLKLDLNGHSANLVLAEGVNLKLLNTSASNYTVGEGSATISGEGTVVRDFLTGSMVNYGHNYRFIVIDDGEGNYTAHRIYLAVKSTSLYPAKTGIKYNTVLRCDSAIAALLNADGGDYGIKLTYADFDTEANAALATNVSKSASFLSESFQVKAFDAETEEDNDAKAGLLNLLADTQSDELKNHVAHMKLAGQAYIKIGDLEITSASVSYSLKDLTEKADTIYNSALTETQQELMKTMYSAWETYLTEWGWELTNVAAALAPESGNEG